MDNRKFVCATGNAFDGLFLVGTFDSAEEADAYGQTTDEDYTVVGLMAPGETPSDVAEADGVQSESGEMTEFSGYHQFRADDGSTYGSFRVYKVDSPMQAGDQRMEAGWYWISEFPGCMPDSEPHGPFLESENAYLDAMGE